MSIDVVATNDLTNIKMANLLKFDTTQGKFNGTVATDDQGLVINGKAIKVLANPDPAQLPWKDLGIDIVLECTGFFTSKQKAAAHLAAGAKKVLISAFAGPIVSSDVIGITYGSLFDATQTKIMEVAGRQLVKTVAWYDNEMSYTSQLVRTLKYVAEL